MNRVLAEDIARNINWGSPDHVSACLYGGILKYKFRERYTRQLKNGTKEVERWGIKEVIMPRLIKPLPKTECAKEGYWLANKKVLASLKVSKQNRHIMDTILRISTLDTLVGTYYRGLPKQLAEHESEDDILHGNLNQCVAQTGRLSSSNPNLQNMEEDVRAYLITRY